MSTGTILHKIENYNWNVGARVICDRGQYCIEIYNPMNSVIIREEVCANGHEAFVKAMAIVFGEEIA